MLTTDKTISTPEYWNSLYNGERDNAAVDSSNGKRPANAFDRFAWVAKYAEGPRIIDIGSGHAHICKRIKSAHPDWEVIASDQAEGAKMAAGYLPYHIFSGYDIPYPDKTFNTLIISQALEYVEHLASFMQEAVRVSERFLCTVPIGEMKSWSQLHIFREPQFVFWLSHFGTIEATDRRGDLLLVKIKFHD